MKKLSVSVLIVCLVICGFAGIPACSAAEPNVPPAAASVKFRIYGNRIWFPVTLNGATTCEAILDTGAEVSLLNAAKVNVNNLRMLSGGQQLQGAFVGGLNAQNAMLDALKIDKNELKNIAIGVIRHVKGQTLEPFDLILGMDIFRRMKFTLDFDAQHLILWPLQSTFPPKLEPGFNRTRMSTHRAPNEEGSRPRIYGTLNDRTNVSWLLDTGADLPNYILIDGPERHGLKVEGPPHSAMKIGIGSQQYTINVYRTVFETLTFDKLRFPAVEGRITDARQVASTVVRNEMRSFQMVLGTPFLLRLKALHIDMAGRVVYFDRNAGSETKEQKNAASVDSEIHKK